MFSDMDYGAAFQQTNQPSAYHSYPCILICGKVMSTSLHIYLLEKTELILEDDFNFP
jgi:hypothetical protein